MVWRNDKTHIPQVAHRSHAPRGQRNPQTLCVATTRNDTITHESQPLRHLSDEMMREKLEYIHNNSVKRGYVDHPEYWHYSSARNYLGSEGLIAIDVWH